MLCGIVHGAENESGATMEGAREVLSLLQDNNLLTRVGEALAVLLEPMFTAVRDQEASRSLQSSPDIAVQPTTL